MKAPSIGRGGVGKGDLKGRQRCDSGGSDLLLFLAPAKAKNRTRIESLEGSQAKDTFHRVTSSRIDREEEAE